MFAVLSEILAVTAGFLANTGVAGLIFPSPALRRTAAASTLSMFVRSLTGDLTIGLGVIFAARDGLLLALSAACFFNGGVDLLDFTATEAGRRLAERCAEAVTTGFFAGNRAALEGWRCVAFTMAIPVLSATGLSASVVFPANAALFK